MDLMRRRRELLGMQEPDYVRDGLVFWLDGLNQGGQSNKWIDRIGNHAFNGISNPVFGYGFVATDATTGSYLNNSTLAPYPSSDATIEVAISDHIGATQLVFMPLAKGGGVAFGLYGSNRIIWNSDTRRPMVATSTGNVKTASININLAVVNGEGAEFTGGEIWVGGSSTMSTIGRRSSGSPYTGKIHAIRIYNRHLTADEMIHNQRIDNKRFKFGLEI